MLTCLQNSENLTCLPLQAYPRFWPKELDCEVRYGPISVRYLGCGKYPNVVVRAFAIHKVLHRLQALGYDILPSTTAVFSYAIGSRKLSANEQFLLLLVLKQ